MPHARVPLHGPLALSLVRYGALVSTAILYCCDPLNPRAVDGHFSGESRAARTAGATTALIDHDALLRGDEHAAVRRVPRDLGAVWYRGWMIPTLRYQRLAEALDQRGARLVVGARQYQAAHELPGWYPAFAEVTPRSVWLPSPPGVAPDIDALAALVAPLGGGPAVVKDFVKSRKHEWSEACFVADLADAAELHRVVARFVQLQEEFLAGGVVVRGFERFDRDLGEARVWWLDGEPVMITSHPDTPDRQPSPVLDHVAPLVRGLKCRFITTDMAMRTDGTWRVVEVGDGQVSDLPRTVDPSALATVLTRCGRRGEV